MFQIQNTDEISRRACGRLLYIAAVGEHVNTRVLIVDDEDFILLGLGDYFRSLGYKTDCARDLEQASALLEEVRYDLVITDTRLSRYGGEGLQVIEQVKRQWPGTPTILLTSARSSELETEANRRGVDLLLDKPFLLQKLGREAVDLLERERHKHSAIDNSTEGL